MKNLPPKQRNALIKTLRTRFGKHPGRHKGIAWDQVQARLEADPAKLWSLHEMERTGGEPDVVERDRKAGEYVFRRSTSRPRAG